jgi:hypothetical protein
MLTTLPEVLRRAGLTAQAERIEQDVRIRIGDWPTLVVEPDGRVRVARPSERVTDEELMDVERYIEQERIKSALPGKLERENRIETLAAVHGRRSSAESGCEAPSAGFLTH